MAYCVRCGVELQKGLKSCPLCDTEVLLPDEQGMEEGLVPFSERIPRNVRPRVNLTPSRSFIVLATFILLVPLLVTLIIDFTANRTITWSFYPITSLILLWILIAYPYLLKGHTAFQVITMDILSIAVFLLSLDLYSGSFPEWSQYPALSLLLIWIYIVAPFLITWKRIYLIIAIWLFGTGGFLYAIDKLTGGRDWFMPVGLPILVLVGFAAIITVISAKTSKHKTLMAIGTAIFALSVLIIGIDVVINIYIMEKFIVTWSPIPAAVLIPTAIFLIIVNYNNDLKAYLIKKFHM
ncbi:MAG: hypothetical protein ACOYIG_14295 [Acetivibrionales bacterium]|jgi:hypothetical protein|nr:hypothetical protein [Clostridiaceae bacterium]